MLLIHVQISAAGRCTPVDRPHAIARSPFANVGELDPVALRARELVADERLRVERRKQRAHRLDAWIDAQRLTAAGARLPRVKAEPVARTDKQRPDGERAPARAAQRHVDLARA